MRMFLLLLFAVMTAPVLAQDWNRYDNDRFGFGLDIPPGFSDQKFSDNGDGVSFAADGRPTYLLVWGGNLLESFEAEVDQRMRWDGDEAWNVSYQAVTPRWASWSAVKGARIVYQRMVMLCDGASYAAFRAEYSVADVSAMDAVVERLVRSLRARDC